MSAVFQNVLTASFHGSIVILAVLVLRLLLRNAPKKYICLLWMLAGIRLLMPFEVQSAFSLQPQSPPVSAIRWESPAAGVYQEPDMFQPVYEEKRPVEEAELPAQMPETAENDQTAAKRPGVDMGILIPSVWLLVAAMFGVYSLIGYISLKRKVSTAVKIPGGWESDQIDTAFVLGFIRPQIYIPMGMSEWIRRHILAHERTHIEKGDQWFKMIGFLALALHWFNPLVWLAYVLLCKDIEMACDERVVQFMELPERKEYSAALLNCSTKRVHYAASPVAFGEVSVNYRIQSVLKYRRHSFFVGLMAVAAILFVTLCFVTSPAQAENPTALAAGDNVDADVFTVPQAPPMDDQPDWGFVFRAEAGSNTSLTMYYGLGVGGVVWDGSDIELTENAWIEHWNGESWEKLVSTGKPNFRLGSRVLSGDSAGYWATDKIDWASIYGQLPGGDYRIARECVRNGETRPCYAWFHIYTNTLSQENAITLDRCQAALDYLLNTDFYSITISESNEQGEMWTVAMMTRVNNRIRMDHYVGSFCYASEMVYPGGIELSNWIDLFRENKNRHITIEHDGTAQNEIRYTCRWIDQIAGNAYEELCTVAFGADGGLQSIDRLTTRTDADGIPVQSRRNLAVNKGNYSDALTWVNSFESSEIVDSFEAHEASPWNIFFRVDDDLLTSTGAEVWISQSTAGRSSCTTDGHYWLEKKSGTDWRKLESVSGDPRWGEETYQVSSHTAMITMDWSGEYGSLTPGVYRMGKIFYKGDQTLTQYAEFLIVNDGTVIGDGAEEAVERLRSAVDELSRKNYHITLHVAYANSVDGLVLDSEYWKYGQISLMDMKLSDEHCGIPSYSDEDSFYDYWKVQFTRDYTG